MDQTLIPKIKAASIPELTAMAQELRDRIIDVVSQRGGHLAPSLGVVELTLALHRVFESPTDSIIWDVGHQAYAHKIITGRHESFDTLRSRNGIAGFPKRCESRHDAFDTGHSSTSISAAIGIAEGKRLAGERGKTIAVIGDGSMTAGLAFEGLNHAGHLLNKRLIVILNDNQMSIDRNVGALARFMNKGITSTAYNRIRRDVRTLLSLVSTKEMNLVELSRRAALVVKDFFMAGSLFEAFGFRYFGPIDGHDLPTLLETLHKIDEIVENEEERANPILLHVITKKGKGYAPAEGNPSKFHGLGAFNVDDGTPIEVTGAPTYTAVFGESMCELMEQDARIIAITAAMPSGTGLDRVKERFPGRYYDVGIAEPHAVTFAAGLAARGFKPVVAIYSSFLQRSYDEILHDVCLQKLPVIFAIDRAGVVGEDGPTHHGVFDLSYLRHIPGLTVLAPKDENELRAMLFTAADIAGPIAIRYPRGRGEGVTIVRESEPLAIGRAEVVSDPADATYALVAAGPLTAPAERAAHTLRTHGIGCAVINARSIKPLDRACLLSQAARNRTIVTIEDNVLAGGFGSAILELFAEELTKPVRVIRLGYPDAYIEHASIRELHEAYGLTSDAIVARIAHDAAQEQNTELEAV